MSLARREFVAGLSAAALAGASSAIRAAGEPSLAERARRKGLFYGCSVANQLDKDPAYAAAVAREAGLLVAEFQNQWQYLGRKPDGATDFSAGEVVARFAAAHGQLLRGHALIWFTRLGDPFKQAASRAEAERALVAHVREMCTHYAGRMQSWDVVNEPLDPFDGGPDGLRARGDALTEKLGPDYMDIAFHTAREADPKAILVLNEAGIENDAERHERQRRNLIGLIDRLQDRRVPVDAIGLQSHLRTGRQSSSGAGYGAFVPAKFERFVSEITARGLRIIVTELDVFDGGSPGDVAARDREVAAMYADYLAIILKPKQTLGVVTWGLSDRYSWITGGTVDRFKRADKLPSRPLPLDADLRPTPCYAALAAAFDAAPSR